MCYIFYDSQTNSVSAYCFLCFHIYLANLEHFQGINIYIYIDIYVEHSQINIYELVNVHLGIHILAVWFELFHVLSVVHYPGRRGLSLWPRVLPRLRRPPSPALLRRASPRSTADRARAAGQRLFCRERRRSVLLEAEVEFRRGKQFRQRSSCFSLRSAGPRQGVHLLPRADSPGTVTLSSGCCQQP